jgi:hypothetical protein
VPNLRAYGEDLRIAQAPVTQDPSNADSQHGLAVAHFRIGSVLRALGRWDEALASTEQDARISQELVAKDPSNANWQYDLSATCFQWGSLLIELGKVGEGLSKVRRSLKELEKAWQCLLEMRRGKKTWNRDAMRCDGAAGSLEGREHCVRCDRLVYIKEDRLFPGKPHRYHSDGNDTPGNSWKYTAERTIMTTSESLC